MKLKEVPIHASKIRSVPEELRRLRDNFVSLHDKDPIAFLLGPEEYLAFKLWLQDLMGPYQAGYQNFLGIPVLPKRSRGIDLAIPEALVGVFALGTA